MAYNKSQKLQDNISAIFTVLKLRKEGRLATPDERVILRKYNGFGGLKFILNPAEKDEDIQFWKVSERPYFSQVRNLYAILNEYAADVKEEKELMASIKRSVNTAFYTPSPVIDGIVKGFADGNIKVSTLLDPSAGIGKFGDAFRAKNEGLQVTSFEKDMLTGYILSALHPQDAVTVEGFETIKADQKGRFDLVTSNIPFGDINVFDPEFRGSENRVRRIATSAIHNYFFLKSLDMAREGGLVAFITSRGVMDSPSNSDVRREMVSKANLVGAIRLPDGMFRDEAGTEVGSDLIVLQKDSRKNLLSAMEEDFVNTVQSLDGITINGYYDSRKECILTTGTIIGTDAYGKTAYVYPWDKGLYALSEALSDRLAYDIDLIQADIYYANTMPKVEQPAAVVEQPQVQVAQPKPQAKPKAKAQQSQSGPVQLDLFAMWDEQESQAQPEPEQPRINMDPRPFDGMFKFFYRDGVTVEDAATKQLGVLSTSGGMVFTPISLDRDQEGRMRQYILIRDAYQNLYTTEAETRTEQKELREELNRHYDNFFLKFGRMNERKNAKVILMDVLGRDALTMENSVGRDFVKADIFERPVSFVSVELDHVDTPEDALFASLNRDGTVDLEYMSDITGTGVEELKSQLTGSIYYMPDGHYEIASKVLSGNVYEKLAYLDDALELAKEHADDPTIVPALQETRDALEKSIPQQIPFDDIGLQFGERWIPTSYYEEYIGKLFNTKMEIHYAEHIDEYSLKAEERYNLKIREEYCVRGEYKDYDGMALLAHAFHDTTPDIQKCVGYDANGDDLKGPDMEKIQLAQSKIQEIRDGFTEYLTNLPREHRDALQDMYNRKFNCFVKAQYDGSHQIFPGIDMKALASPRFNVKDIYKSQKDCVWMLLQNGGGICDHEVGTGKTLIMCMAAHEMHRLGLANKPMIIALKANVAEIAATYQAAFPDDKILYASEKDYSPANRLQFFNRIKNNDYACVVMSHDQFNMIPQSMEIQRQILDDEIRDIDEALDVIRREGGNISGRMLSGLEKRKENLHVKMQNLMMDMANRKDDFVDFGLMGIDHIFVDESHQFKNLMFTTRHQRVSGLGNPAGSQKALNLLYAIRTIQGRTGKDLGATFLSGTTISNSLTELYLLFKYLRPEAMARQGIHSFDAWAAVYAKKTSDYEFSVTNAVVQKERFRYFVKVPELATFYNEITDYRTGEDVGLDRPDMNVVLHNIKPTANQQDFNQRLVQFAQTGDGELIFRAPLSDREQKGKMLIATDASRKAALDMRLVDRELFGDDPDNKASHCAKLVSEYYQKYNEQKGTQFIFSDLSTYKPGEWNVFQEIKDKLVNDYGIPEHEIRFIQEAKNQKQRNAIIDAMNRGDVRVLFGSTTTLGTGVNAQKRAVAVHHIDIPWRPSDLEQRDGRARRSGNEVAKLYADNNVDIIIYAVERTLDSYKFNLLQNKQLFITQLKTNSLGTRIIDEGAMDEENGMNFAEYVAILSGNDDLLKKAKLEKKILALESERKTYMQARRETEWRLESAQEKLSKNETVIKNMTEDNERYLSLRKAAEDGTPLPGLVMPNVPEFGADGSYNIEGMGEVLQDAGRTVGNKNRQMGTVYGFPLVVDSIYMWDDKMRKEVYAGNKFWIQGHYQYEHNSGKLAMSKDNRVAAVRYGVNALEKIPGYIRQYEERNEKLRQDIAEYERIAGKPWGKEDELKGLRKEMEELDKVIQASLDATNAAVPKPKELPYKFSKEGRYHSVTFPRDAYSLVSIREMREFADTGSWRNRGYVRCGHWDGDLMVSDPEVEGEFTLRQKAEEFMQKIVDTHESRVNDNAWLVGEAQKFTGERVFQDNEVVFAARAILQERGIDWNRPYVETVAASHVPEEQQEPATVAVEQRPDNRVTVYSVGQYGGNEQGEELRRIAHQVKEYGSESSVNFAVDNLMRIFNNIPDEDKKRMVLVPMPGITGMAGYMDDVVTKLAERSGMTAVNTLFSTPHESLYDLKVNGTAYDALPEISFRMDSPLPEGTIAVVVDNVLDTGRTLSQALQADFGKGVEVRAAVLAHTDNYQQNNQNFDVKTSKVLMEEARERREQRKAEKSALYQAAVEKVRQEHFDGLSEADQQEVLRLMNVAWNAVFGQAGARGTLKDMGIDWRTGGDFAAVMLHAAPLSAVTDREKSMLSQVVSDLETGNHLLGRPRPDGYRELMNEALQAFAAVGNYSLTPRQRNILTAMSENYYNGQSDLASVIGVKESTLRYALQESSSYYNTVKPYSLFEEMDGTVLVDYYRGFGLADDYVKQLAENNNGHPFLRAGRTMVRFDDEMDARDFISNVQTMNESYDLNLRDALVRKMEETGITVHTKAEDFNAVVENSGHGDREVFGLVHEGEVYLGSKDVTAETPIHEYTHLWAAVLRQQNRAEWDNIVQMMKDTPEVWNYVKQNYPHLQDDDQIADEALAQFSGRRGAKKLQEFANGHDDADGILAKVSAALGKFWNYVADFFNIHFTSKEDVADRILYDLLSGRQMDVVRDLPDQFHFIGEKGATNLDVATDGMNIANLHHAEKLEGLGRSPLDIKIETGWERSADGKWMMELPAFKEFDVHGNIEWMQRHPDTCRYLELLRKENVNAFGTGEALTQAERDEFARLKELPEVKYYTPGTTFKNKDMLTVQDYVDAPSLFAAYPELRTMAVRVEDMEDRGSYSTRASIIDGSEVHYIRLQRSMVEAARGMDVGMRRQMQSTLAHEIMHYIQRQEGFARGTDVRMISGATAFESNIAAFDGFIRGEGYDVTYQELMARLKDDRYADWRSEFGPEYQDMMQRLITMSGEMTEKQFMDSYEYARQNGEKGEAWQQYWRSAGEVQARVVQARMGMSLEARRHSLAADFEDVPREQQIFTYSDVVAASREPNVAQVISMGNPAYLNSLDLQREVTSLGDLSKHVIAGYEDYETGDYVFVGATADILASADRKHVGELMNGDDISKDSIYILPMRTDAGRRLFDSLTPELIHKGYRFGILDADRVKELVERPEPLDEEQVQPVVEQQEHKPLRVTSAVQLDLFSSSAFDDEPVQQEERKAAEPEVESAATVERQDFDPTQLTMRQLGDGEQCYVERRYTENGFFSFVGGDHIESDADVAYIFRSLEDKSVENSFICMVKDGRPTVIHLGIGDATSVMAPIQDALLAFKALEPEKIWFIHNHPSGNLKVSREDFRLQERMENIFGAACQPGIIINTTSGQFMAYTSGYELGGEHRISDGQAGQEVVKTYAFDRNVFEKDWDPMKGFKGTSPAGVAGFVSSHRLGDHEKLSLLVMNQNGNITGNVFLPWTHIKDVCTHEGVDLISQAVLQMGGNRCLLYGSEGAISGKEVKALSILQKRLRDYNIALHDVTSVERSLRLEGIIASEPMEIGVARDGANQNEETAQERPQSVEPRSLTPADREAGGAMVDHLERMGITVHTDLKEYRAVMKQAEKDNSVEGNVRYFTSDDGRRYGFSYKGEMYLDLRKIDAELPLNQYARLWCQTMQKVNPDGWNNIVATLKNDPGSWQFAQHLSAEGADDSVLAEEVICQYSGKRGAEKLQNELQRMSSRDANYGSRWGNIFQNISKAIQDFWKHTGDSLNVEYKNVDDISDMILKDFATKVNPVRKMENWLKDRDKEYAAAVAAGDMAKAQSLFTAALQEHVGNGITPYIAVDGYRGRMDRLARNVKSSNSAVQMKAINEAADRMAPLIGAYAPDKAVLVPAPSHHGMATDMLALANAISERTGIEVADVLKSDPRQSQYDAKRETGKPLTADQLGIRLEGALPEGKMPVVVDNVVNSGNTAEACIKALGSGLVLSVASAVTQDRHVSSLKSAVPVLYDRDQNLIPLSERFEFKNRHLAPVQGMEVNEPVPYQEPDTIQGLESYDVEDIRAYVLNSVNEILEDAYPNDDIYVKQVTIVGSRSRGEGGEDSDLDILLEYGGKDVREDDLFNLLNDEDNKLSLEGIDFDINPINEYYSLNTADWLKRDAQWREEDRQKANINQKSKDMNTSVIESNLKVLAERLLPGNFDRVRFMKPQNIDHPEAVAVGGELSRREDGIHLFMDGKDMPLDAFIASNDRNEVADVYRSLMEYSIASRLGNGRGMNFPEETMLDGYEISTAAVVDNGLRVLGSRNGDAANATYYITMEGLGELDKLVEQRLDQDRQRNYFSVGDEVENYRQIMLAAAVLREQVDSPSKLYDELNSLAAQPGVDAVKLTDGIHQDFLNKEFSAVQLDNLTNDKMRSFAVRLSKFYSADDVQRIVKGIQDMRNSYSDAQIIDQYDKTISHYMVNTPSRDTDTGRALDADLGKLLTVKDGVELMKWVRESTSHDSKEPLELLKATLSTKSVYEADHILSAIRERDLEPDHRAQVAAQLPKNLLEQHYAFVMSYYISNAQGMGEDEKALFKQLDNATTAEALQQWASEIRVGRALQGLDLPAAVRDEVDELAWQIAETNDDVLQNETIKGISSIGIVNDLRKEALDKQFKSLAEQHPDDVILFRAGKGMMSAYGSSFAAIKEQTGWEGRRIDDNSATWLNISTDGYNVLTEKDLNLRVVTPNVSIRPLAEKYFDELAPALQTIDYNISFVQDKPVLIETDGSLNIDDFKVKTLDFHPTGLTAINEAGESLTIRDISKNYYHPQGTLVVADYINGHRQTIERSLEAARPVSSEVQAEQKELYDSYKEVKAAHEGETVLLRQKGFMEAFGKDADKVAEQFGVPLYERNIGGENIHFVMLPTERFTSLSDDVDLHLHVVTNPVHEELRSSVQPTITRLSEQIDRGFNTGRFGAEISVGEDGRAYVDIFDPDTNVRISQAPMELSQEEAAAYKAMNGIEDISKRSDLVISMAYKYFGEQLNLKEAHDRVVQAYENAGLAYTPLFLINDIENTRKDGVAERYTALSVDPPMIMLYKGMDDAEKSLDPFLLSDLKPDLQKQVLLELSEGLGSMKYDVPVIASEAAPLEEKADELSANEAELVSLIGKGNEYHLTEPVVINVDDFIAKDVVDSITVNDSGTIALYGRRIDEAGASASFNLFDRDEYEASDIEKVLNAVKAEMASRQAVSQASQQQEEAFPQNVNEVRGALEAELVKFAKEQGADIPVASRVWNGQYASWNDVEKVASLVAEDVLRATGKQDFNLANSTTTQYVSPAAEQMGKDLTAAVKSQFAEQTVTQHFERVQRLVEDHGLDYVPLTLRVPVTVEPSDDELADDWRTEKKVFGFVTFADNGDSVYESREDAYDDNNAVSFFSLPEESQHQVLNQVEEMLSAQDQQMTVYVDTKQVPEWAINTIVNGTIEGLTDEEMQMVEGFEEDYKNHILTPRDESPSFNSSPAFGPAADTVPVDIVRIATPRQLLMAQNLQKMEAERNLEQQAREKELNASKPQSTGLDETIKHLLEKDTTFRYQLLSRMQTDVKYFLGNGNHHEPDLWAKNAKDHIIIMDALMRSLPEQPMWLSSEQLIDYADQMGVGEVFRGPAEETQVEEAQAQAESQEQEEVRNYTPEEMTILKEALSSYLVKNENDYYHSKLAIGLAVRDMKVDNSRDLRTAVTTICDNMLTQAEKNKPGLLASLLPVDMGKDEGVAHLTDEALAFADGVLYNKQNDMEVKLADMIVSLNETVKEFNDVSKALDSSHGILNKPILGYDFEKQNDDSYALMTKDIDGTHYGSSWMSARALQAKMEFVQKDLNEKISVLRTAVDARKSPDASQGVSVEKPAQEQPAEKKGGKHIDIDYTKYVIPEGVKVENAKVTRIPPKEGEQWAKFILSADALGKHYAKELWGNDVNAFYEKDDNGKRTNRVTLDQLVAKYFGKQFAESMSIGSVQEAEHVLAEKKDDKVHVADDQEKKQQEQADKEKQAAEQKAAEEKKAAEEAAKKKAEEAQKNDKKEKVPAAILQTTLLMGALASAKEHDGQWLNRDGKLAPDFAQKGQAVSPFNALMMGLHSDANGYKTNDYTTFNAARSNGYSVKGGESGLPFNWYNWDKYVNRFNSKEIISKEEYEKLPAEEKELYKVLRTKEERSVFNIDQTTMPLVKTADYNAIVDAQTKEQLKIKQPDGTGESAEKSTRKLVADLKVKHPDAIILMRNRDFYEAFGSDADTCAKVLGVALTHSLDDGEKPSAENAMISFPHHSLDIYLPKLVRSGARVAICDALEDPRQTKRFGVADEIYSKAHELVSVLKKEEKVFVDPYLETGYDVEKEVLRFNEKRMAPFGQEVSTAIKRLNETYRAAIGYTGGESRLNRIASSKMLPADAQKYDRLVSELAAGVLMSRHGLPATLSKESLALVPYWERELKESPRLMDNIERDVNNAVEVLTKIKNGETVDYSAIRGQKAFEAARPKLYTIATELATIPDANSKLVVVVKDQQNKSAAVILPAGASLEVNNEITGLNKNRFIIALRKQGFENVEFFNAGGALGLNQSNEFFADKTVEVAKLKQFELVTTEVIDLTAEIERTSKVEIEKMQITSDDNGHPMLYVKPAVGDSFTVYPEPADVKRFFQSIHTPEFNDVREQLAQKYYALVLRHPDLKREVMMPDVEGIDLSRITKVNITKDKYKENTTIIFATIDGEAQKPKELSELQAKRFWLVDDQDMYKLAVAAQMWQEKLSIGNGQSEDGQAQFRDHHEGSGVDSSAPAAEANATGEQKAAEEKRGGGIHL